MNRLVIGAALALLVLLSGTAAYAYPIGGAATGTAPAAGAGSTILARILRGIQGIGASLTIVPANPWPTGISASGNNWGGWLDTWLFSIAGFHIVGFASTVLSVYSWLLGVAKSGVDWLLGVIH